MSPSQLSMFLNHIASKIELSSKPNRDLVMRDLNNIIAALHVAQDENNLSDVDEWQEKMWEKANDEQYDEILKTCGEEAAKSANYGWGDASNDDLISYATKVYEHGVLLSTAKYPNEELEHEWVESKDEDDSDEDSEE